MNKIVVTLGIFLIFVCALSAQVPTATLIKIVKAEDARAFDTALEALIKSPNADIRKRAALAAGRIGDDKALPTLAALLETDVADEVRAMAAFAIGEIESVKGFDAVLKALNDPKTPNAVRARTVEAAGKIAAANAKDEQAKALGLAILDTLKAQSTMALMRDNQVTGLAITAALRARPDGADVAVAKFLTDQDPRIRADAANTLTRLRAKNANEMLRKMLETDRDGVARANAARALGAAEDKDAVELLIKSATSDSDGRVRVAAVRALVFSKSESAARSLLSRAELVIDEYKASAFRKPTAQNELLELFVVLGRLMPNSNEVRATALFREFAKRDLGRSPEAYIARVRIAPGRGDDTMPELKEWRQYSTLAQVVGEFSAIEPTNDEGKKMKSEAADVLRPLAKAFAESDPIADASTIMAAPDVLQAFAKFKTNDLAEILRLALTNKEVQIRATAAGLLADQPRSEENVKALKAAFPRALLTDKMENDAQLAIIDALFKLDKKESVGMLLVALKAADYLLRKSAFEKLADKDLLKDFPGVPTLLANARKEHRDIVLPYSAISGTKLGQVLNSDADYRRAVNRKNGSVKAVFTTEKGTFTIDFMPEHAPLTVDNFVKLARSGYFNGLEVHRVVPNFVMQDGDPRGDGNGGPGWSIRCEVNMLSYDRGAVGMALSGKDTGGSQWFVTHSPQPHLDGGYTVFGNVNETGMKVVDNIVRGDKIISVKIVETKPPRK